MPVHTHDHGASSASGHPHAPLDFGRAFRVGIALNLVYVVVEAGVGFWIGSLGLIADAGHNLSDVLSLAVAWVGSHLARRPPTLRFTYGYARSPILASLFNALLLFGAMAIVAWESVRRLQNPAPVPGLPVVLVTTLGLVVNFGTAMMFTKGRSDLNIRGAYLHMMADGAVTLGVLVSGLLILFTGALWLDPLVGLAIVVVVLWSTWGLFRDAMRLSLDAVPEGIDVEAVRRRLEELPGVREVHDLHVWALSTNQSALTAHLVAPEPPVDHADLIRTACQRLHEEFEIEHTTLQVETRWGDVCGQREHGASR